VEGTRQSLIASFIVDALYKKNVPFFYTAKAGGEKGSRYNRAVYPVLN
jgi:hypothetical protein